QNIFKNAPSEIVPSLQGHYGALQLSQSAQLSDRMIREQKNHHINNTALASQMNIEHAYSLGLAGNDKEALASIENTRRLNQADVARNMLTSVDAKARVDSARQSYLN